MDDSIDIAAELEAFHGGHGTRTWQILGAWPKTEGSSAGWHFAVWSPNARAIGVIGDFNDWHPTAMTCTGDVWVCFVPGAQDGQRYKFQILQPDGQLQDKADPFARHAELRPHSASRLAALPRHRWRDGLWIRQRPKRQQRGAPLSIYEVHLGSWLKPEGRVPTWREIAEPLAAHVTRLGFTHVELLPLAEYPYDPSWGYQVTGFFAPTARFGEPDDLRYFVDHLHRQGIGVLVDWVPAHFPRDGHGLGRFDGLPLYEHPDPRRGEHPDWGTLIFDYGRPEVRSFLLSCAHYWLDQFHIDGFRVDAVASMLYLDYSRAAGTWLPNIHGGNWNLEAIAFLQDFNAMVQNSFAGALTIAEDSTAFPGVTRPREEGGLGFSFKWNMGWMHDTLKYLGEDPIHRAFHHDTITFSSLYHYSEAFVLPLSHDEVVHGKGSLLRKMGGPWQDRIAELRLLYGYQWAHPGRKLLFMGQEFAQEREWDFDRQLDWHLCEEPARAGLMRWVGALNALYRGHPAMHRGDGDAKGFNWVDGSDAANSILVWSRLGGGKELVFVLHFTPVNREAQHLPMPSEGTWTVRLHSHLETYGGHLAELPAPCEATSQWGRPMICVDVAGFAVIALERT